MDQILERGGEKLGIEFDSLTRYRIVKDSDGFPYYTHLMGLHCARRLLNEWHLGGRYSRDRREVSVADFDSTLDQVLNDCNLQLVTEYRAAIETTGQVRVRKSILEAIALESEPDIPFQRIREGFLRLHPEYAGTKLTFLSPAMKRLTDEHGILVASGKARSTRRLYRFRNPLMKGYVLLQIEREKHQQPDLLGHQDLADRLETERMRRREPGNRAIR